MEAPSSIENWQLDWKTPSLVITLTLFSMAIIILALFVQTTWKAWSDYRVLDESAKAGEITTHLLAASDQQAAERGFTIALLSTQGSNRQPYQTRITQYREAGDAHLNRAIAHMSDLSNRYSDDIIFNTALLHLEQTHRTITDLRARVDRQIQNNSKEITLREWFRGMTNAIEREQLLRELVLVTQTRLPNTETVYWVLRNWAWGVSEYLGRERASMVPYLLSNQSISDRTLDQLAIYRENVEHRLEMITGMMVSNSVDKRLVAAVAEMQNTLSGDFNTLRKTIYSHAGSADYTVTGEQWLDTSTQAIQSVLTVSSLCSEIIQGNVDRVKQNRLIAIISLLLLVFMIILMVARSILKARETAKELITARRAAESTAAELQSEMQQRREIQAQLKASEQGFLMLVMKSTVGIIVAEPDGMCVFINSTARAMLNQAAGKPIAHATLASAPPESKLELDIHHKEYTWGTAEAQVSETIWDNKIARLILLHDITSRKEAEDEIRYMAYHDRLTGLANRSLFKDRLAHAINRTRRNKTLVAVLFFNIDRFKIINDTLGQTIGDDLLNEITKKLLACIRNDDTVGRMGGDEFAVLIEGILSLDEITVIAQKIQRELTGSVTIKGHSLNISISVGISTYPGDVDDPDLLIQCADTAMFHAKEQRRGSIQFFKPEMSERFSKRLQLENSLHNAITNNEFEIYYQPIVNVFTMRIVSAEALLRWKHPYLGLVSPNEFIPILEEMGLITRVGKWVIENVCAQNKSWQESGLSPLVMAVNLSPVQILLQPLEEDLREILAKTNLEPKYLELEITETALMQSPEACAIVLQQLIGLGVSIVIDDFGTGHSSLSHLNKLPISKLKIDRSFVMDIPHDPNAVSITSAVISLARSLKLDIIGEGVETAIQLNFLREYGCSKVQGYYFSKPLPALQFEEVLRAQSPTEEQANSRFVML